MQKYLNKVKAQIAKLQSFSIVRIPREENIEADYLSKLATAREDAIPPNAPIRYLELPSIFAMDVQVQAVDYNNSWTGPIADYIQNGALPDDNVKARQLKIRAAKYLIMGDVLYKRSFSLPYLRCLIPPESTRAMEEVHKGICGDHQGGRMLSYKLLRLGYYWPSMQKDCKSMVQKCEKCQRFANIIHGPPTVLTPMRGSWPFAQWGVDLIGPLPMAAGQVQHAIVAVDYFTKWVEAKALATITAEVANRLPMEIHYKSFWAAKGDSYGSRKAIRQRPAQRILYFQRNTRTLRLQSSSEGKRPGIGYKSDDQERNQEKASRGQRSLARRALQCAMGISYNTPNSNRRNPIFSCIRGRGSSPN
ncbi:hypothetical protein RHGRI_021313 [Rhododendron griersonianum]|uniref:Integrase zinc-binding domain-containing protein n=1 Tax=Rhododendron griersonianum TaxID=479676 RepID=A0AAV6JQQ5_9ERIC|nr:hypothetical protein RHGRI_021313 [Rhododendron griersonianum]